MAMALLKNHASFLSQSQQVKTGVQRKSGPSSGHKSRKATFLRQASGTTSPMVVGEVPSRQLSTLKKGVSSLFPRKSTRKNVKTNKNCGAAQSQTWQTSAVYFASTCRAKSKSSRSLKAPCSLNLILSDRFFSSSTKTNSSQLTRSLQ